MLMNALDANSATSIEFEDVEGGLMFSILTGFRKELRRVLIFAAIVATFVYGMIAAMLGTILPDLSDRFQLTPRQNGIIAFAQALGLIIASLAVGPLLDDEGKKAGLMLGLAFISFALFALPRSSGFRSVVVLLFFLGVGGGIVVTGANALISDVSETHRASALNLVNLFFGLGGLATPFISAHLFARKWVRLCYTVAVLTVITFGIQAVTKMPPPTGAGRFILADAGPVLGRPLLFLLGFFLFLYVSCEVGVWNWLTRHLIAQGIPESSALNILSLGFALGLLIGRVGVSPILVHVSAITVLWPHLSPWPLQHSSCSVPESLLLHSRWFSSAAFPWLRSFPPRWRSSATPFRV